MTSEAEMRWPVISNRWERRCTNKANLALAGSALEDRLCETNPISALGPGKGVSTPAETPGGVTTNRAAAPNEPNLGDGRRRALGGPAMPIVPNKPNLGPGEAWDKCCVDKEL